MHGLVFELLVDVLQLHGAIDHALLERLIQSMDFRLFLRALVVELLEPRRHVVERARSLAQFIFATHIDLIAQIALRDLPATQLQRIQSPCERVSQHQRKQPHQQQVQGSKTQRFGSRIRDELLNRCGRKSDFDSTILLGRYHDVRRDIEYAVLTCGSQTIVCHKLAREDLLVAAFCQHTVSREHTRVDDIRVGQNLANKTFQRSKICRQYCRRRSRSKQFPGCLGALDQRIFAGFLKNIEATPNQNDEQ